MSRPQPLISEAHPSYRSVKFNGVYVNLAALGRMQGIDSTYLSRIFRGEREPSLSVAKRIAAGLGMELQTFLDALDVRIEELKLEGENVVKQYNRRKTQEKREDAMALARGKVPVPRLELET